MGVDADVSHRSVDASVCSQHDVPAVDDVLFGETEVHNVDEIVLVETAPTDEEVVGLHVTVDDMPRVDQRKPIQLQANYT